MNPAGALPPRWGNDPFARMQRGALIHALTPRPPVGLTPYRVIHRQDKLELRYYAPRGPAVGAPLVLVPSMINRSYILDLEPDRSLIAAMCARGHAVYLVDWGTPGPEDAEEDVGYVLLELLHRSIDRVCRHARAASVALFGYCQGGTLAAMYAALRPARVRALVALNAPVAFEAGGRFRAFVAPGVFDVDRSFDGDGLVPTTVMRPGFQLLDPVGSWTKFIAVDEAGDDPERLRRVLARERWLEENVPVSGAFAREFIRNTYQEDRLLAGTWIVRGERVDLARIGAPLLLVCCAKDFICPTAAALPLADAVGSTDKEVHTLPCGHIGVVVGAAGPRHFYPLLDGWLRRVAA